MPHTSALHCHPASPCAAITALHVATRALADGGLQLRFALQGNVDALRIPPRQPALHGHDGPVDELWRHTCFEAFIATDESSAYREFNFSPSGQWAVYAFTDYRQRDTSWRPQQAPHVTLFHDDNGFSLEAYIPAALLPVSTETSTAPDTAIALHVGLAAVIEANDGTLSYWALAHTGERPDFHQRAAFALRLDYDSRPEPHIDLL